MPTVTHSDIVRAFGFQLPSDQELESIYPYAPVYRLSNAQGDWIVKRTQKPLARGRAIAAWTQALATQGIQIITPARSFGENPRAFHTSDQSDEVWVVYPFVAGIAYTGDATQIGAAGGLLGEIHAIGAQEDFGLKRDETMVAIEAAEIEQDIEGILQYVRAVFPEMTTRAGTILAERTQRYFQQSLPKVLETRLPLAICSYDYKASNLIYQGNTSPVLVDPDNAACIARTHDLAIAALLFHNEARGPCRLFTQVEWVKFLDGYAQHVQFTEAEKQIWDDLLLCVWVDEGLWLLRNDQLGWAETQQAQVLLSLLFTDLSTFALSW
jgi:Ser/Thr protein kinase RdoA (MazF antagonist)